VATANPIVGTATLIERDDALSSVTPAEGDWIGLRGTAEGALWTQDFNSDTITTHLSEIEGAVETIEGAVSGSEMQVDVVASLPAGSNTIGVVDLGSTDNAVLDAMVVDLAAMEALLITIDSDTDAIKTAVQILDDWDDSNYANVNINLAGSDAPTGGGAESGALRVTLANDSTGVISIDDGGNSITVDGTLSVNSHAVTNAGTFVTQIDGAALTALQKIDNPAAILGTATYNEGVTWGSIAGTVRNDTLAALVDTDNEIAPLQVNASGALYIDIADGGQLDALLDTIKVDTEAIETAVELLDNAISGSEMQVDVVAALPAGTNAIGLVGHDITGMVSDLDADVGTTAEKIHTAADVAIKRIDIQANRSNTGYIYVGDSGVAGDGTGGGISLAAGDFYSLDIDNTGDVYVAASVADEDVSYIYYT